MSAKKPDMEQLRKYLNGELDARAMHKLEREAHEDPFLWDVMKGMENGGEGHQSNIDAINQMIDERVEKDKRRVIPMWKVASIAASVLLGVGIGGWLLMHQSVTQPIALNDVKKVAPVTKQKAETSPVIVQPVLPAIQQPIVASLHHRKANVTEPKLPAATLASAQPAVLTGVTYKNDTTEYRASAYPVKADAKVNDMLKKLPGFDVDANGNVTAQGKPFTKVRVNGKDYFANDVKTATQNLPADIIEKVQVIDDYSDMANQGVKTLEPSKVLNIATKNSYNKKAALSTDELLKRLEKLEVDSNSIIKAPGQLVAKSRIYAKSYNDTANKKLLTKAEGTQVTTLDEKSRRFMEMVTGRVVDHDSKIGLPGASVSVAGSNISSQTDANGKFSIAVPAGKDVLNVGYIGYSNQQIKAKSRDSLNISLSPNSSSLNEVVVSGYGTTKKLKEVSINSAQPVIGWKAYNKYLADNALVIDGNAGVVKLSFVISANGVISNITIVKGLNADMDQRAIKLIQNGPKWILRGNGQPQTITQAIQFHK